MKSFRLNPSIVCNWYLKKIELNHLDRLLKIGVTCSSNISFMCTFCKLTCVSNFIFSLGVRLERIKKILVRLVEAT